MSNLFTFAYSSRFAFNATVRSIFGFFIVVVIGVDLLFLEMNVIFMVVCGVGVCVVEDVCVCVWWCWKVL